MLVESSHISEKSPKQFPISSARISFYFLQTKTFVNKTMEITASAFLSFYSRQKIYRAP